MYHISFICSSVEEHLGCVQSLAIMNEAAVNIVEKNFHVVYGHPLDIYLSGIEGTYPDTA